MIVSPTFIKANLRVLFIPVMTIVLVAVIAIFALNVGYSRITTQISGYNAERKKDSLLQAKLDTISKLDSGGFLKSEGVLIALPESNPATTVFAILRTFSNNKEITLTKVEVKTASGITEVHANEIELEFNAADLPSLFTFLESLSASAPITTVNELNLQGLKDETLGFDATMKLTIYWSGFPTKLPSITEPITDLTDDEKRVLSLISSLNQPIFSTLIPEVPKERTEPFN